MRAGRTDVTIDGCDGANVQAARRLCGEQKLEMWQGNFPPQHGLLLVSTRERSERDLGTRGAHVETGHQLARSAHQFLPPQKAERSKSLQTVEKQVLSYCHLEYAPDGMAILGHDPDSSGREVLRAKMRGLQIAHENAAAAWRSHA